MKLNEIVRFFRKRPFFETKELTMLLDEPPSQIQARLSRLVKEKKLIQLRRGKYILDEEFRYSEPSIYYISNYLYRPSYVSLHSALEFHNLIPEAVGIIQAITPRQSRRWTTPLGRFYYHSIKQQRFFGYQQYFLSISDPLAQTRFSMACPEKALLDLFYFNEGDWTMDRLNEMRFRNLQEIDFVKMRAYAKRFKSPKIERAVVNLVTLSLETAA